MEEKEYKAEYEIQFADNGLIYEDKKALFLEVVPYTGTQKLEQDTNVIQYLGKNLTEDLFIAWDEMPEYDKFKINITIKPIK